MFKPANHLHSFIYICQKSCSGMVISLAHALTTNLFVSFFENFFEYFFFLFCSWCYISILLAYLMFVAMVTSWMTLVHIYIAPSSYREWHFYSFACLIWWSCGYCIKFYEVMVTTYLSSPDPMWHLHSLFY